MCAGFGEGGVELLAAVVEHGKVFVQLTKLCGEFRIGNSWLSQARSPAQNVVDGLAKMSHKMVNVVFGLNSPRA